jgi:ankyrin repeat-rich membrane spanning protein
MVKFYNLQYKKKKPIFEIIVGIPSINRSVNLTYISLISILGASILLSCATWLRLLMGLMKSPKSKIMKFSDRSSRLNENSLYRLKKEVNHFSYCFFLLLSKYFFLQVSQLSYITKSVEAFLSINTRLVVLIDGLDVCEQQRILQILDVNQLMNKINHIVFLFLASTCTINKRK